MREIVRSQISAALEMLRDAVEQCDEATWTAEDRPHCFWHVAYHALFYTDLYLSPSPEALRRWPKAVENLEHLVLAEETPLPATPYTRDEILDFWGWVRGKVDAQVDAADFEASSGFSWLPFSRLELQIYNIRHLQHHVGQLADRLRETQGRAVEWKACSAPPKPRD